MMQFVDPRIFEGQLESLKVKVNYPLFLVAAADEKKSKSNMFQKAFKEDFERQSIRKKPARLEASREAASKLRAAKKQKPEEPKDKQMLSGGFFSSRDSHKLDMGKFQETDKLPFAHAGPQDAPAGKSRYVEDKENFRIRFQSARSSRSLRRRRPGRRDRARGRLRAAEQGAAAQARRRGAGSRAAGGPAVHEARQVRDLGAERTGGERAVPVLGARRRLQTGGPGRRGAVLHLLHEPAQRGVPGLRARR